MMAPPDHWIGWPLLEYLAVSCTKLTHLDISGVRNVNAAVLEGFLELRNQVYVEAITQQQQMQQQQWEVESGSEQQQQQQPVVQQVRSIRAKFICSVKQARDQLSNSFPHVTFDW